MPDELSTRVSKLYVNELCHRAQTDSRIMNELYLLATDDDEKTSWNALWILSCLTNQESLTWLCQKHDELINLALKETHDGKRRLILNLLSKQEFDKDGLRTDFIDFCMSRMLSATETVASKADQGLKNRSLYKRNLFFTFFCHCFLLLLFPASSPASVQAHRQICPPPHRPDPADGMPIRRETV